MSRKFILEVSSKFSAAHFLPSYDGDCANMHGHTWKCEVAVDAGGLNNFMGPDFKDIKSVLKKFIVCHDHKLLNDLSYYRTSQPTCEMVALNLYNFMSKHYDVDHVTVWESDGASVTVMETDK